MNFLEIRPLKSYQPTNYVQIDHFEKDIKAQLPKDYVEFLIKYTFLIKAQPT